MAQSHIVSEVGRHEELMQRGELYSRLYQRQMAMAS
jgi:ABC-type multidrug transport system fused ATPase/permease subunit